MRKGAGFFAYVLYHRSCTCALRCLFSKLSHQHHRLCDRAPIEKAIAIFLMNVPGPQVHPGPVNNHNPNPGTVVVSQPQALERARFSLTHTAGAPVRSDSQLICCALSRKLNRKQYDSRQGKRALYSIYTAHQHGQEYALLMTVQHAKCMQW